MTAIELKKDIVVYCESCFVFFDRLGDNSIDLVISDPPYFLDGLDDVWNKDILDAKVSKAGIIKGLPIGMKFDKKQSYDFQEFMVKVAQQSFRVLKPGGFYISFAQARLYHRLAVAVEDVGFDIRDMLGWKYEGQAKAFSMNHFIMKMKHLPTEQKQALITLLGNRKTPQLKPMIEPMVLAQKPKEGTFIDNWVKYGVGLVDTTVSLDGKFPGNIMEVKKPSKKEKGFSNEHLTVKPLELIEHLIKLFSTETQVVCDPFLGSGTTALAAYKNNRKFIGSELNNKHIDIIVSRMKGII